MHRVIVGQYITLDGVTQDPAGLKEIPQGGWVFRYAPGAVKHDSDNFRLGKVLDRGALLVGRGTWQFLSRIWRSPPTTDIAVKMDRVPKLVASNSLKQVSEWNNSMLLERDLVDAVRQRKTAQDLIVFGSGSIVQALMQHDLIDEYRLSIVPVVLGEGRRLFRDANAPVALQLENVEQVGEALLVTYRRAHEKQQ
jgi:dihydrofolate reductase